MCLSVCVLAPLCREPVCTTRLAFAGSNSAGRARAAWLACVCVPCWGRGVGGLNRHPAVCRATSASASVCESCVCHVVAAWSRVRRRFGSSAGRILNVYTYTYTNVYVRTCNCVRLNMFSRVPGILQIVNLE